jgi:hypothetical protein
VKLYQERQKRQLEERQEEGKKKKEEGKETHFIHSPPWNSKPRITPKKKKKASMNPD